MSERKISIVPGEYYHVYNRGNSKQQIFLDAADYKRFLLLLYVANGTNPFKLYFLNKLDQFDRGKPLVALGAYCLMPNHFHLLITPIADNGVAKFMQKVTTGYSMFFNNKYDRTGSLFEGKYKAEHAADDIYLKYLYAYIHLNPLKLIDPTWKERGAKDVSAAEKFVEEYEYSSFPEYLNVSQRKYAILKPESFPPYFQSNASMKEDMFIWFKNFKQERPV